MAYIDVQDLSYTYPDGTKALRNISFSLERGSRTAVLGANGTGKSTLFLLLSGLLKHRRGSIALDGRLLKGVRKKKSPFEEVGITFQNPDVQIFAPTVFQEVAFGPGNQGLPQEEVRQRTEDALEHTALGAMRDRPVQYLSYGQKKRVAIADILAMKNEIVILDEPLAWLDRKSCSEMMQTLDFLKSEGKTILISTHDSDFAWQWADRVLVFADNTLIGQGSPEEVFADASLLERGGIKIPGVLDVASALNWDGQIPGTISELSALIREKDINS